MGDWTFFSNHGHVLFCLARDHDVRLREVAAEVGITERAVQKIVRDLQDAGFLTVTKQGRCNRYRINKRRALRHSIESHCTVGKLLALIARPARAETRPPVAEPAVEPVAETPPEKEKPSKPPPAVEKPKPAKQPPAARKKADEDESSNSKPVDVRQQGSLF